MNTPHRTASQTCPARLVLPLSLLLAGANVAHAGDDVAIKWYTIDSGGGVSTGGGLTLTGTIGQPDAGRLTGGTLVLEGGFWPGPTAAARCSPADIADDQGNPLPPPAGVPNNGVNEGDYNLFFNSFFTNQALGSPADIADDQGTPLPPFGTGGQAPAMNSGVNEGDYNAFFNSFFNGCII
ncbi:hypothetical protein BH11PLA1_BH11PLA1_00390 [soil metagenome]